MGYLRKECSTCGYWKKIGQHCGAIMHGMKCIAGPLPSGADLDAAIIRGDKEFVGNENAAEHNRMMEEALARAEKGQARIEAYAASRQKAKDTQVAGDHYKKMGVEPWDVVDTWPLEQRIGAYRHGALKYLMRMGSKDQNAQEIAKGKHYMEKLLEVLNDA